MSDSRTLNHGASGLPIGRKTKIIILSIIVAIVFGVWQFYSSSKNWKNELAANCIEIVADWSGVSTESMTWEELDGNVSGVAIDLQGTYPGGEWRCAAATGEATPRNVMVYEGGYGSNGAVEHIYP